MDQIAWTFRSANAKDFITKLLNKDPKQRMSAAEALKHPWLTSAKETSKVSPRQMNQARQNLLKFSEASDFKKTVTSLLVNFKSSEEDLAEIKEIWSKLDVDKNGYLSLEELQN